MFESAELGHQITKMNYDRDEPILRARLLSLQYDLLAKADFPVVIIIGGVDGAGKGETVNLLNEWMDPRHIVTHAFGEPSDEERERPRMWRYWRALPPRGRIGILFGAWHTDADPGPRCRRDDATIELDAPPSEIVRFERMLVDEGALLLKFWFHLSKERQKKRLKALEADPQDPLARHRAPIGRASSSMIGSARCRERRTAPRPAPAHAPWIVVEGTDPRYRSLTVGKRAAGRRDATAARRGAGAAAGADRCPAAPPLDGRNVLSRARLDQALRHEELRASSSRSYRARSTCCTRHPQVPAALASSSSSRASDAAGKGGAIRRVTGALDARHYQVIPIAAPTEEERAQPYLWRFWRHLPRRGAVAIFDRSWYGRVLVERVEGFAARPTGCAPTARSTTSRSSSSSTAASSVKFWLPISKEEQLRRFKEREETRVQAVQDHRRRTGATARSGSDYERAVCDMVDRTKNAFAPWDLVPANDKYFARVKVLRTLCERIEAGL